MLRIYSSKAFFRQMPNPLLARYFQVRGLFGDMDFSAMKEGKPDELFQAWLALPDSQRNRMDAEFRDIFEMSCEKGFQAIIDEANWQMRETPDDLKVFVEKMSALSNHYERAMIAFLDYNTFWMGATRFYHADTLPYWRKRKNMPKRKAAVDAASLRQLAALIRNYFHYTEGRGKTAWLSLSAGGRLIIISPIPRTIRSIPLSGTMTSLIVGLTTRPSRSFTSTRKKRVLLT